MPAGASCTPPAETTSPTPPGPRRSRSKRKSTVTGKSSSRTRGRPGIPERWLRDVWHRQSFDRIHLATTDGRRVRVFFPGIPNDDEGPDFLRARIRIGTTLFRGDVEIHRTSCGWTAHKHHRNPHYNSVILHVVLTDYARDSRPARTCAGRLLPTVLLLPLLTAHHTSRPPGPPTQRKAPCSRRGDPAGGQALLPWLVTLATQRLEQRVSSLRERHLAQFPEEDPSAGSFATADEAWDQLLYEGIMEALGYAKNQNSFLALARNLPLARLKEFGLSNTPTIMSLLFGAGGLLPPPHCVSDDEARRYLRQLQCRWNDLRPSLRIPLLGPADWRSFRLRPANFPAARIAALCPALPVLFPPRATAQVLDIMAAPFPCRERTRVLTELFTGPADGFWRNHIAFGIPSVRGAVIGRSRILEIIINTLIPLGILLCRETGAATAERALLDFYAELPSPASYRIIRRLSNDIPSIRAARTRALLTQGMLQLEKCYCRPCRCSRCVFGRGGGVMSSAASSSPRGRECCSG